MAKLRVGVIFGGRSAEHEISLLSARNVVAALNPDLYDVTLIGIDRSGRWHQSNKLEWLLDAQDPKLIRLAPTEIEVAVRPGASGLPILTQPSTGGTSSLQALDVVIPILHGPFGEDGTVQGLLKLADVPFVGPGVLGSAVGMDKDVMKRLLRDAGIPIPKFSVFHRHQRSLIKFDELKATLGDTIFVKPANMGSSVGVSRVRSTQELEAAITEAFRYDTKILIEQGVTGREIEVSVLGNEHPEASLPGEIMPKDGFYSYDAKYIDDQGARLDMPAKLSPELTAAAQKVAIETFQCLCCEGLSRVDLFLTPDNRFLVNEINTLPGFTSISMYPKLWEISGLSYSKLLDKLIQLALERHERDSELAMGPDGARANA